MNQIFDDRLKKVLITHNLRFFKCYDNILLGEI